MPNRKNVLRMDKANALFVERASLSDAAPVVLASGPVTASAPDDWIFALDIGTRTVIGVVGVEHQERYKVLAAAVHEHVERAMMDGQIHDIAKVTASARIIKDELEQKLGHRLEKVSIAAAGRVLKTCQVHVSREIDDSREIDMQLIGALEMEGIRLAQDMLVGGAEAVERNSFHCVGYSVISYQLDDFSITNLLGHKGSRIGMEILATFLPHMVVDSLHTVMERIGLKVTSMTLEPIAALNVAIPKDLRMLNLALVDVGAGTSDIAITKAGTVVGYAMASVAGDEITETIAQHFLVDFQTAEQIKLSLGNGREDVSFLDIMDNKVHVKTAEVSEVIRPAVESLACTIAEKIQECNAGKSPNAVFLVGGGSQTPGLCARLAELMGLPLERVAVRNRSIAKSIDYTGDLLQGPECITPFGILVTANLNAGRDFFHVSVSGQRIRLYNARRMTVADALLQAGYVPDQLIGKSGRSLRFLLNGLEKTIRGGFGKPSEITLNGMPIGLTASVLPGDTIEVREAERGEDATGTASDFLAVSRPAVLLLSGSRYEIPSVVYLNGVPATIDSEVTEGSSLVIAPPASLSDIVRDFELDPEQCAFECDGHIQPLSYAPSEGEVILCVTKHRRVKPDVQHEEPSTTELRAISEPGAVSELPSAPEIPPVPEWQAAPEPLLAPEPVFSPGRMPPEPRSFTVAEIGVDPKGTAGIRITVNNQAVLLPEASKDMMFVDIFNHIDFDLSNPKGTIVLKLNGKDAGFTDSIKPGDNIEVFWRE